RPAVAEHAAARSQEQMILRDAVRTERALQVAEGEREEILAEPVELARLHPRLHLVDGAAEALEQRERSLAREAAEQIEHARRMQARERGADVARARVRRRFVE